VVGLDRPEVGEGNLGSVLTDLKDFEVNSHDERKIGGVFRVRAEMSYDDVE